MLISSLRYFKLMKKINRDQSRRKFLKQSLITASALQLAHSNLSGMFVPASDDRLNVHIFSKHLQFLDYTRLAQAAAEMGFDGIDLSVRPNGHVEPERVEEDLPKAVEAMKKAGLSPLLMTTAVEDASNPVDKKLLETAAKLGFKYYRMNWYPYPENKSIPDALDALAIRVKHLGELNKKLNITGAYQNHAGTLVGSSVWEIWELLEDADPHYMGAEYDIRHAMVEGFSSWPNGLRLLQPKIKVVTLKDFKWQEKDGKWSVLDVPVGEGLIDFKNYFRLLKQYKLNGPVTLHIEHPLGGSEQGNRQITMDEKDVLRAIKKDLDKIREYWQQA
jgi:L-ribulose-5-phosphate 3-epimerase